LQVGAFTQYWLLGLLQADEPEEAWAWLRDVAPEMLGRGEAILADEDAEQDGLFYKCCPELYAWLLLQTGQEEKARALLQRIAEFQDAKCAGTTTARRSSGMFGACMGLHVVHGLLGHREETLALLRRTVIEDGWSLRWWFFWDHGALNFLQDDPEYLRIMQVLEDRLAVQRERVRELERNGELPMAQWEIEARQAPVSLAQTRNGTSTAGHDERR
jgi:hypothetical protein